MGKPDYDFPPGEEPEKPWPIDPRPAIRDLKEAWADLRKVPPWRRQTPAERRWAIIGSMALLSFAAANYWIDRFRHPPVPRQYISAEKLTKVEKGMSQKEVRDILGEPPEKEPDCWRYDFSDDQFVCVHFRSMFKVAKIEYVKKRVRDSER